MDIVINGISDNVPSGSQLVTSQNNYHLNLLACLGYNPLTPPLAALLAFHHQLPGKWLIASPMHWESTYNDAMITALGDPLAFSAQESLDLFADLQQFLGNDNFPMVYHDLHTWLVKLDEKPAIFSKALRAMHHQSLMPAFAAMDETLFWQRLLTELQMYLSTHPLNSKRDEKLSINGVWFWGAGELNQPIHRKLFTDDEDLMELIKKSQSLRKNSLLPTEFTTDSLLVIKYPQQIDLAELQDKMHKYSVQWHWNNLAYSTKRQSWWRFW